jgi:hypothetical protein
MSWTAKIVNVDTRYDSVSVQVEVTCDAPPLTFTKSYDFQRADDLTKATITGYLKTEIQRIGDLYTKAEVLKANIGQSINLG